jgi:hypothetical protein
LLMSARRQALEIITTLARREAKTAQCISRRATQDIPCYVDVAMIAEIFPEFYDVHGRRILHPGTSLRRKGFRPTSPMGSNLTQPLKHKCSDFDEMRRFLCTCRAAEMQHRKGRDYWQPPEEFEKTKTGDCVDFALWFWRQLLDMGYAARFTGGKAGKFGAGHAWVTFEKDGKFYLLEPQRWPLGIHMPRLSTLRYHPAISVAWDGKKIVFFEHEERDTNPPFRKLPVLIGEWLLIWGLFWIRVIPRIPRLLAKRIFGHSAKKIAGK